MKKTIMILIAVCISGLLTASLRDELIAVKTWLNTPFSAAAIEAERDAKLGASQYPVKGEFETTAQFEQRKKDTITLNSSITADYTRKIADARAAYESYQNKLSQKLNKLLSQSRETVALQGTLGSYDADTQKYRVSITDKTFEIVVPLDKAPTVKTNFASSYTLEVTRQLNADLKWEYLEASLKGQGNVFASTDKATAITGSTVSNSFVPPDLSAVISFVEPSGNNALDADETAELNIRISNGGRGIAYMVEAKLDMGFSQGVSYPGTVYFGEIKAGESQNRTVELIGALDVKEAELELKVNFSEQNGFPPDNKIIRFSTKALDPPDLCISDVGITDNSKNGKIEPGEQVELRVRIHNRGSGMAKAVNAEIVLGKNTFMMSGNSNLQDLGNIAAGEYKDILFSIVTAKTALVLEIKVNLSESRSTFNRQNLPLNLAFNRLENTAEAMIISAKNTGSSKKPVPSLSIDIEQNIPILSKPNKNRWAVIIGIENYRNVSSVSYALRDAEYMKEYFVSVLGIPSDNIYMKTDDAATQGEFNTVFNPRGWLANNASNPNSEIYIYYSGHGAPDVSSKKAYLLPYDGNPNYASISGYDLDQLYANLKALQAKQITLFLDSCFSGANRDNEIILADARPVFISTAMPTVAANLAVFSAASGSQISSGYSEQQHGLFSYFLMKGMRGEADANGDKKLTHQELSDYLSQNVGSIARRLGREQNPQLQSADPGKAMLQW